MREAIETENQAAVLEVVKKTVPTFHMPEEVNRAAAEAAEMQEVADAEDQKENK